MEKLARIAFVAYAIGWIVTAFIVTATYQCPARQIMQLGDKGSSFVLPDRCLSDVVMTAWFGGIVWPFYWTFRMSHPS